jgi:hypothetical protein
MAEPPAVSLARLVSALQFAQPGVAVRIDTQTGDVVEGTESESASCRTIDVEIDELDLARRFCERVADATDRKRFETALSSAQPMESFENALYRAGIAHEWFPFREQQIGAIAKAWLEGQGIPLVDDLG